jgi:dihydroxyacetone kinase
MHKTIDMQANRGRASYLGPRAIGHQDPGATSLYYLIETAADTLVAPVNTKNVQPAAPSAKMPRTK